jgi:hypothetical protein
MKALIRGARGGAHYFWNRFAFSAVTGAAFLFAAEVFSQTCVAPPSGLVGWWQAEGNAKDITGTNNGILVNGATFAAGKVGQSFLFNGVNQYVTIPNAPALNPTSAVTLEAWINWASFGTSGALDFIVKDDPYGSDRQYMLGMVQVSSYWVLRPAVGVPSGLALFNGSVHMQTNTWYHVAMTYDGATLKQYINGVQDGSLAVTGAILPTSNPLIIGGEASGPWDFAGKVDEVSLYNRALSATEIQAIYNAGIAGKCLGSNAPSITLQPASESVLTGSTTSLNVIAAGSAPLSYQWAFNGTNNSGATLASLSFVNVQPANAGIYSVVVSNNYGSITSSNALLTVNTAPFITSQPQGLAVSQGDSASFSVTAGGDSPLSYQWQFNSSIINGATNSSYSIAVAQATNGGTYRVLVSNPFGSVLSSNAVLTVNSAPIIVAQPADATVTAGNNATFVVGVAGSAPLSYQWQFGGSNISSATTSALTINNAQSANAGAYSVTVTNAFGSAISSNAQLTVNSPNCITPPSGLVGWWPGSGNAQDSAGTNNGTLKNGATFAPGEVDQAFLFNGVNQYVTIPNAPELNPTNAITLEAWINWASFGGSGAVDFIVKDDPFGTDRQYMFGMVLISGHWFLRPAVGVPSGLTYFNGSVALQTNTWYHVAMTYDGATLKQYINGVQDGSLAVTGAILPTSNPLIIGGEASGPWDFAGKMDEVSLYNRALNVAEIQAIYNAGSAGKCQPANPPTIFAQPASQAKVEGANVTFTVGAAGSTPLSYQWEFNGTNINGATDSALTLTNIQPANGGNYSVVVTNEISSTRSSNALPTVTLPPSMVQVVSVTATSGIVTVPIILVSQGDENALRFSINFPST